MRRNKFAYNTEDTIAAISTPVGESGIGIVRLSGKKALPIADKIFVSKDKAKPSGFNTYTLRYGHIIGEEIIDEALLTVMRGPKSYTKEDVVEINCHGGIVSLRKVLDLVLDLGARLALPGEFTKRAFLNGRIDLAQAEAVLDVISSKTESSIKQALRQLEGEFSERIKEMKERLTENLSELEAEIDFSHEDIDLMPKDKILKKLKETSSEIKALLDNAWKGMVLKEGILCVICGKPNVGKSSLMNVLLRRNRVIVTPVPGTTRDAIEEEINLKDVPVRVVDTAGIARPKNIVEKHGIEKSKSYIKMADLILFMLDSSKPWAKMDMDIFDIIKGKNTLIIANKSDLAKKLNLTKVKRLTGEKEIVEVSILRRENLDGIEKAVLNRIWRGDIPHPEGLFITNLRHKKDLECANKSLKKAITALGKDKNHAPEIGACDLRDAVFSLGSILGETVEPDILDRIFSKFCIGK